MKTATLMWLIIMTSSHICKNRPKLQIIQITCKILFTVFQRTEKYVPLVALDIFVLDWSISQSFISWFFKLEFSNFIFWWICVTVIRFFCKVLPSFFSCEVLWLWKSYYWNKFCFPLDYLTIINTLNFTVLVFGFCDRMFKKKRKAKSVRYGVIRNVLKFELNLIKKKEWKKGKKWKLHWKKKKKKEKNTA